MTTGMHFAPRTWHGGFRACSPPSRLSELPGSIPGGSVPSVSAPLRNHAICLLPKFQYFSFFMLLLYVNWICQALFITGFKFLNSSIGIPTIGQPYNYWSTGLSLIRVAFGGGQREETFQEEAETKCWRCTNHFVHYTTLHYKCIVRCVQHTEALHTSLLRTNWLLIWYWYAVYCKLAVGSLLLSTPFCLNQLFGLFPMSVTTLPCSHKMSIIFEATVSHS